MLNRVFTVTGQAANQDLASLAIAKDYLGITGSGSDVKIARWIVSASDAIARACLRVFASETISETLFLDQSLESIVLRRYPVSSIATVTLDGIVLNLAEYIVDPETGILLYLISGEKAKWVGSKVEITYVAGYNLTTSTPPSLSQACLALVAHQNSSEARDPMAKRVEIPDVMTIDYWVGGSGVAGELPPEVVSLIQPYRNWTI
jgi:uncharacterized phiE125 gp8 family phage protein